MEVSSPQQGNDVFTADILPEFLSETDDFSPERSIKEEMIEEVMQELYREIAWPAPTCTEEREASPPPFMLPSPSSSPGQFFVESGKSESCGPSMSDSASSVMAGVRFAGGLFGKGAVKDEEEEELMDGCDGVEFGDEWLEKVMGWAPLEVEG